MPGRRQPLVTSHIYHVVNRGIADQKIFLGERYFARALDTFRYYQNSSPPLRYSYFIRLPRYRREEILGDLAKTKDFLVEILAYCFMPNHIHLLLKQTKDKGVSVFMSNVSNSYTRYFNTKRKRVGPIFQGKFKAVLIKTDDQLMHVSRYIHLNPYSAGIVKRLDRLPAYPYSSFSEYLGSKLGEFCERNTILSNFKDTDSYKRFVFDQADYQRELQKIKRLVLEA